MLFHQLLFRLSRRLGGRPSGARLQRILASPQFRNGQFQNRSPTPQLAEGYSYSGIMKDYLFTRRPLRKPAAPIPSVKTDLHALPTGRDLLVWFGHSSYLLQLGGRRYLVDPVLSGNASPLPGTNRAFTGADIYRPADLPPVDCLLITHDHYDHLDYQTVRDIRNRVGTVFTGLGVGAHLERWGYAPSQVRELDWGESAEPFPGVALHALPARHFSGRGLERNNTLWLSFALLLPGRRLYLGGDSGPDAHFAEIGERFGPFDLALLENGQYNPAWKYIHAAPEEVVEAAIDLRARALFPVHYGKFAMATHDWDEPLERIAAAMGAQGKEAKEKDEGPLHLVTPRIGEVVYFDGIDREWTEWWKGIPKAT